jgi:DNA-binding MarR family transcriptional regulator
VTADEQHETPGGGRRPEVAGRRQRPLGPALRQAWIGYQRRLDAEMAAAGFEERGFPDGRVLRLCSRFPGLTAARIGRELGISRQGAGKIVANLQDRGYVTLGASPGDAREKIVTLMPRGAGYLAAQRAAVRRLQDQIREAVGADVYESLYTLLEVLDGETQPGLRDYLRRAIHYPGEQPPQDDASDPGD